jgi:type II secretory pathway pseudopilin PulG
MTSRSISPAPRAHPRGFSLLEVLVACGILVIGLASIAAILPAAGSRLGEASAQDRAMAAATAAMVEIRCRGLASRDMFPSAASGTAPAIVFGETLPLAVTTSATALGYSSGLATSGVATIGPAVVSGSFSVAGLPILSVASPAALSDRIYNNTDLNDRRGCFLEDEVQYRISTSGTLPLSNSFVNGTRQFNRGVCWGAMLTPEPWGVLTGRMTAAKASVAVFKKPGNAIALTLTRAPNPTSEIFVTGSTTPVTLQRTILKPCSMVLAIPPNASAAPPQWLSIRSSWILTGTMIGTSGTFAGVDPAATLSSVIGRTCVTFAATPPASLLWSGTTLQILGFENLLLVNEQTLPIQ